MRPLRVALDDLEPGDLIIWDARDALILDKWPTDSGHLDVMGHVDGDLFASKLFADDSPHLLVWKLREERYRHVRTHLLRARRILLGYWRRAVHRWRLRRAGEPAQAS